ncbi:centrosomal protein of 290 kDa-like isoform X2 [Mya arenaria]|uniref:centrosomal protein of 290 kDa-like isoform X2 n=1 Tax=Mya arenaria TaxID=6604 RepID=UPI0022E3C2B4|nr:centrosomal protein of 290 kDa-like isoform X2 [Mya arenaria]
MASAPADRRRNFISPDTNSKHAPPVAPKPSGISRKRDDNHEPKQAISLPKGSDAVAESLHFTVKYLEELMREPSMFVLGLQHMVSTVNNHKSIEQQLSDAHAKNDTLQKYIEEHQRRQDNADNLNAALQDAIEKLHKENETSTRKNDEIKALKEIQFQKEEEIKKQETEYEGKIFALESQLKAIEISYKNSLDESIAKQKEQMEIEQTTTLKEHVHIIENLNKKLNELTEENKLQIEKNADISNELQQSKVELETNKTLDGQVLSKIWKIAACDVAYAGSDSSKITNESQLRNKREEVLTQLTDKLRQSSAIMLDNEGRLMLQHVKIHLVEEVEILRQQIQKQRKQQLVAESFAKEEITKLEDEIEDRKRKQTSSKVFAEKDLDKMEFQLQDQITKRRFVEKYLNQEIIKMEHALEDKKRCLKLAESFAETEISTLETKMERKESTLKLVQRFSDAEITRLEDEVNECLHLKYVLEAEVAFLRQESIDLQHEVAENDHSQTHLKTALTALDGLQNTVSSLQKRVKELEAIISSHENCKQHQMSEHKRTQTGELIEGNLNICLLPNGRKKDRKHWSMNFTQLDGSNIVFYVPWNDSQPTKDYPHGKPELIVPLLRCKIKKDCTDYTSKKNTFVLKTSDKMLLLQADNETDMQKWFLHIQRKITELGGHPDMTGSSLLVPKKMVKQVADRFVKKRLRPLETKGIVNDAIFGGDIKEICSKEKSEVPMFLVKCIDAIESRGLHHEGIYRIVGSSSQIKTLQYMIDQGERYDLGDKQWDIHVLCGILLLFFRKLKNRLFEESLCETFLKGFSMEKASDRLQIIKSTLETIHSNNYKTVKVLFKHLCNVMNLQRENKMGVHQLAFVFGPRLIPPLTLDIATCNDNQRQIVEFVLLEYKKIFE